MGNKEKCLILGLDYPTIHIHFKNKAVIIARKHSCIIVQTFIYRHENTFYIILDINNACTCIYLYMNVKCIRPSALVILTLVPSCI